jgi:hypothetical protein
MANVFVVNVGTVHLRWIVCVQPTIAMEMLDITCGNEHPQVPWLHCGSADPAAHSNKMKEGDV